MQSNHNHSKNNDILAASQPMTKENLGKNNNFNPNQMKNHTDEPSIDILGN